MIALGEKIYDFLARFGTRMKRFLILFGLACSFWSADCAAQLTFDSLYTGITDADRAIDEATNSWAAEFQDDITIRLSFGFANLGQDVLSSASPGSQLNSYVEFWNAIGNDVTSEDDITMYNGLPTGTSFSLYINQTQEASGSAHDVPYVDSDGGWNNSNVRLTTANAKALGLRSAHAPLIDGVILFNSSYDWDYEQSDGIADNALDFVGIATHEIGHAMGFESGVDVLEANGEGQFSDDAFDFVSSIDFLRFSSASEGEGADIDWTADSRAKYFSIDGGLTPAIAGGDHWSTGEIYGDGEQPSHWKNGLSLGIMNPTSDFGLMNSISALDVLAFDAIGYDRVDLSTVPEPGGIAGLLMLGGLLIRRRT